MQTELIKISGMTCGGCVNKVTQALKKLPGVDEVNVSLEAGEATIHFDERRSSPDQLNAAVKAAGYELDTPLTAGDRPTKAGCCG